MKEKLIVIGNGMAGMRCVEELLDLAPDRYEITVLGKESRGNYNRIQLTPVLQGTKSVNDIMLHDRDWYRKNGVELHCGLNKVVTGIDRQRRLVVTRDGARHRYDKLVIATGSRPHIIPIPGHRAGGVTGFRDIADVRYMIDKSEIECDAVVLGGGLLGLEAANGLARRGMRVTVVNRSGRILDKQLDEIAAPMLQAEMEQRGVNFRLGQTIRRILQASDGHIDGVELEDRSQLPAGLLVMATGIVPNIELARESGLDCERGIVVGDDMRSSDARVYAIGECVQHRGELFGLVAPSFEHAGVCARRLAGDDRAVFRPSAPATKLKVSGIDLFSLGDFRGGESDGILQLIDHAQRLYRKIVLRDNKISGVLMYGDTRDSAWYSQLMREGTDVGAWRDSLIFGRPEMPDAA